LENTTPKITKQQNPKKKKTPEINKTHKQKKSAIKTKNPTNLKTLRKHLKH